MTVSVDKLWLVDTQFKTLFETSVDLLLKAQSFRLECDFLLILCKKNSPKEMINQKCKEKPSKIICQFRKIILPEVLFKEKSSSR